MIYFATFGRFAGVSMYRPASMIAAVIARAVLGYFHELSGGTEAPSRMINQMSWVVMAVKPMLSKMARAFHAHRHQKPSDTSPALANDSLFVEGESEF